MKKNSIIYTLGLALATASLVGCGPKAGPSLEGIRVKTQPTVTEYAYEYTGDVSLAGIEVEAYYSNETTKALTENDYQHSSLTPTAAAKLAGKFTVTLTYQEKTTTVDFTFREPDPFDHEWPAAKVAKKVEAFAGQDVVPAWNGPAGSKFIVEDDYSDVLVVLPGEPTLAEKQAAVEAYNDYLVTEAVGYKAVTVDDADDFVSPHYTLDVNAFIYSEDQQIYINYKPHQGSDYFAPLFEDFTDKYPETLKNIDENAYATTIPDYTIMQYVPAILFATDDEHVGALSDRIVEGLMGEGFFTYLIDEENEILYLDSPHEEYYVALGYDSEAETFTAVLGEISEQFYTQGTAFPSEEVAEFLGEDHATVPALADATRYLYGADSTEFEILVEFANHEAAVAANSTYVALLTDYDAKGDGTFVSKDGTVKLEVYVEAAEKYLTIVVKDAAIFPLDAINEFLDEEYTEEQLPVVEKAEGVTFESAINEDTFVVTVSYPDATKAAAAFNAYKALFTEELGYRNVVNNLFYNAKLSLKVNLKYDVDATSFTVEVSALYVDLIAAASSFFLNYAKVSGEELYLPELPVKTYTNYGLNDFGTFFGLYIVCDSATEAMSLAASYWNEIAATRAFAKYSSDQSDYRLVSLAYDWFVVDTTAANLNMGTTEEPNLQPCFILQMWIDTEAAMNADNLTKALGIQEKRFYDSYYFPTFNHNKFDIGTTEGSSTVEVSYEVEDAAAELEEVAELLVDGWYYTPVEGKENTYESDEGDAERFEVVLSTKSEEVEGQTVNYMVISITPIVNEIDTIEEALEAVYDATGIELPEWPADYVEGATVQAEVEEEGCAIAVSYENEDDLNAAYTAYVASLTEEFGEPEEGVYSGTSLMGYVLSIEKDTENSCIVITIMPEEE